MAAGGGAPRLRAAATPAAPIRRSLCRNRYGCAKVKSDTFLFMNDCYLLASKPFVSEYPVMMISRSQPASQNVSVLAQQLSGLNGPCVGCTQCDGLCAALIDALTLPEVILSRKRESQ